MAESFNTTNRRIDYYCHFCKTRIPSISESFTCPNCNSGFIEEIENPDVNNDANVLNDIVNDNFFNVISDMNFNNVNSLYRIINTIMTHSNNAVPYVRLLHGNPEDYAWGNDGLDTVITQLLNQIDNTGPPPMPEEDIKNLNDISINKEHVNANLQCPICMEDFILDENVKELSCHHFFHKDCIVEWLKLHATCPTCRELLNKKSEIPKNSNSSATPNQNVENPENSSVSLPDILDYEFSDDLD